MNLKTLIYSALFAAVLLPTSAMGEAEPRDSSGRTPLMNLVWKDSATVQQVEQLLAAGADINARDNDGNTVLMRACRVGWYCHEVPGDFAVVPFLVDGAHAVGCRGKSEPVRGANPVCCSSWSLDGGHYADSLPRG